MKKYKYPILVIAAVIMAVIAVNNIPQIQWLIVYILFMGFVLGTIDMFWNPK